jgi:hypothetical protein
VDADPTPIPDKRSKSAAASAIHKLSLGISASSRGANDVACGVGSTGDCVGVAVAVGPESAGSTEDDGEAAQPVKTTRLAPASRSASERAFPMT